MSDKLFVFTASRTEAYQHYIDTIEDGFTLDSIKDLLKETEYKKLQTIYGDRKLRAWGAVPGPNNIRTWKNLTENNRILIYKG